ncbi:Ulp1 protease family, carboxy-terminal domain protein [Arachis hypogaea]|nr:Ulp1 protease family, carboxy-terminal domain protein [Arachis hypogaea]
MPTTLFIFKDHAKVYIVKALPSSGNYCENYTGESLGTVSVQLRKLKQVLRVQDVAAMDKEQIKEPASLSSPGASAAPFMPRSSQLELPPTLLMGRNTKPEHPITTTSLAERISQIEADIADVRFVIRNQKLLNEDEEDHHDRGTIGKSGATLRTYKRKKNATPTTTGIDPGYPPIPTPPCSPEGTPSAENVETNRGILDRPLPQKEKPQRERGNYLTRGAFLGFAMSIGASGRRRLGKIFPVFSLQGMSLTFFPTKDMKIVGLDLCAAAYIFNTKLDQDELLVRSPHCAITRCALRTLEPRKPVVDDVLILLACMLAGNSTKIHWFLPTTFSQIATGRGPVPHATLKAIWEDFMGKANRLVYLDSLPSEDDRPKRLRQLKKVAIFLEEVLDSDDWYDDPTNPRILCSDYEIKEPKMIMYHLWNSYEAEKITDYSRIRLAVDMVLKYHNDKRMEVIQAALEYWRNLTNGSPATN